MRAALLAAAVIVHGGSFAAAVDFAAVERTIAADPENLRAAADYRQQTIAAGPFDRSIDFLEKLSRQKGSGPNIHISLALAYVDKVPTSGDIRRLYLGRDAIRALSRAIERQPSVLAYYVRGQVNLYYNKLIFKQIPNGIADLKSAVALMTADTPPVLGARVFLSLGDGYWKLGERAEARSAWMRGSERYPADAALQSRLGPDEALVTEAVTVALYVGNRVDTSLRGIVP
jgi:hypothetical protein